MLIIDSGFGDDIVSSDCRGRQWATTSVPTARLLRSLLVLGWQPSLDQPVELHGVLLLNQPRSQRRRDATSPQRQANSENWHRGTDIAIIVYLMLQAQMSKYVMLGWVGSPLHFNAFWKLRVVEVHPTTQLWRQPKHPGHPRCSDELSHGSALFIRGL